MMNIHNTETVPFNDLSRRYDAYSFEINEIAKRVLSSGYYILGPETINLETKLTSFFSAAGAVATNSGTDSLHIALRALNIGQGDEVITVANTCTPTIAAIRMTGAKPIFVDVEEDTLTMNPDDVERCITSRTKAILPVHLYGLPADMTSLMRIAEQHKLYVVEDCAQSIGATVDGVYVGMIGSVGCISFYPTKNLGAFGDAGVIVSQNEHICARASRLRVYGEQERNNAIEEGVNSRIDEIQAALVSWGLENIFAWNQRREDIAKRYLQNISNPSVKLPVSNKEGRVRVWHLFVVQVSNREKFLSHLSTHGVKVGVHYPHPVYKQKGYDFLGEDGKFLKTTERVTSQVVSLPLFPELTDIEVGRVIEVVNSYQP
jgi:dTDP-4-amino-4,6-dideoxygalactose transaminase